MTMKNFNLSKDFLKRTAVLMLPVILQQLISIGINFMDNLMVGSFGETQIAAASFGNQFYGLFQFICMGLGSGAIVMSSQFWGSGERDALKTVAAIALRFTLGVSAVFLLVSVAFPAGLLRVYSSDPAVVEAGKTYLRLIGCTFIFAGMSSTATYLLRSTGHVRIPLISYKLWENCDKVLTRAENLQFSRNILISLTVRADYRL